MWQLISSEFNASNKLLIELSHDIIEFLSCSTRNFILSFFKYAEKNINSVQLNAIYTDYITKLPKELNLKILMENILKNLGYFNNLDSYVSRDILISSALYNTIQEKNNNKRISLFVKMYDSLHEDYLERHIYFVNNKTEPKDNSPDEFLGSIIKSVEAVKDYLNTSINFELFADVKRIQSSIFSIANSYCEPNQVEQFLLGFKKGVIKIQHISMLLSIDSIEFPFEKILLYNYIDECAVLFEPLHSTIINQSEHVYYCIINGLVHMIAFQPNLSIMFNNINKRYKSIIVEEKLISSNPISIDDIIHIKDYEDYDRARKVISVHNGITETEAESCLLNWLSWLPIDFHKPLVTLISGHLVMEEKDLISFTSKIESLRLQNEHNLILMKWHSPNSIDTSSL